MALTRLRIDELVSAWIGDDCTPFQIALLGVFDAAPFLRPDGTVDVPCIRAELIARARRVAALGQRVMWTRGAEGRPVWVADPSHDPAAHVESATLPAGADLASWAANRILRPLDLTRPLWRAEVVDGLPGARFAVLIVVHHVLADGRAGMALASSLLDTTADAAAPIPLVVAVPPLPSHRELVRERRREIRAALRRLRLPAAGSMARLRELREGMAELRAPVPTTSLPQRVGPGRRLAIVRQLLEDLQRSGHALGVTLNDLLLAAVTGGLREQLTTRGDPLAGLVLRTTVPAATGRPGQAMGMLVVDLPVGEPDALRRLALISRATATGKTRLRTAGGDVTDMLHIPTSLARVAVQRGRRFGSRWITLSVTDVTGPLAPLWLAGAELQEAVPVAPLVPLVPLSVAALSYSGELAVSVNADASVTDVHVLADGIQRSFALLRDRALSGSRLPRLPAPLVGHGRDIVECAVDIARSAEDVFAYCTDPGHEPEWNPQLAGVEKLTAGPIGPGTRYRMRFCSGVGESIVEYVAFDPPRAWASTGTSTRLDVRFEGEVVPDSGQTRLRFRALLRPRGALRPLAPWRAGCCAAAGIGTSPPSVRCWRAGGPAHCRHHPAARQGSGARPGGGVGGGVARRHHLVVGVRRGATGAQVVAGGQPRPEPLAPDQVGVLHAEGCEGVLAQVALKGLPGHVLDELAERGEPRGRCIGTGCRAPLRRAVPAVELGRR